MQFRRVQTGLARFVASKLENTLGGHFSVGSIQLLPFNAVVARDIVLLDDNPYTARPGERDHKNLDTLARIGRLSATLSLRSLLDNRGLHLHRVELEDLLFQLTSEPDSVYGSNLSRVLRLAGSEDDGSPISRDSIFTIDRVRIHNARYRMVSFLPDTPAEHGIDYGDMDVTFDLKAHDVGFHGGRCHAVVEEMRADEKSGYSILDISGRVAVGLGKTEVDKMHFADNGGSDLHFKKVTLSYDDTAAWSDFVRKVDLDVEFEPSHLVLGSISGFSGGVFWGNRFQTDIRSGRFKGTVSDFTLSDLAMVNPTGGVSGTVNGRCSGIPDTGNMAIDASLDGFRFTFDGLEKALGELGADVSLSQYAPGVPFTLNGKVKGILDDFTARLNLNSPIGGLDVNAKSKDMISDRGPLSVGATFSSEGMNLGKLLGNPSLGPCAFNAGGSVRLAKGGPDIDLDRLEISRLNFLGYDYRDISLNGAMDNGTLTARLDSGDPNAAISLLTDFNIKGKSGKVNIQLDDVDLAALNLDTRGGKSRVSCTITADQGLDKETPASIYISDLRLTDDKGTKRIGDIDISARVWSERWSIILNSDVVDFKFDGISDLKSLLADIKRVSVERDFPAYFTPKPGGPASSAPTTKATASAVFHKTDALLSFLMPELTIAEDTAINFDLDNSGVLLGYIKSPLIAWGGIKGSGIGLALDNRDETLSVNLNADQLKINDISFDEATLSAEGRDNRAQISLTYEGADLLGKGSELFIDAGLGRGSDGKPALDVLTEPSFIRIKNDVWELSKAHIQYAEGGVLVEGFSLVSEGQSIALDGATSPDSPATLNVDLHNLDLGIVNEFVGEGKFKVYGVIDGRAALSSPFPSELGLGADLSLQGLELAGHQAGDFHLVSAWDDTGKDINLKLLNTIAGVPKMSIDGSYGIKSKAVDASVQLDSLDMGILSPFVEGILTQTGGAVSGIVHAYGNPENIRLESDGVQLQDVLARISYTNVAYILNGTIGLDGTRALFNSVGVKDTYGGIGVLGGSLSFKDMKDFSLDAALNMHRLKAIDIPSEGELGIYGDLAISGNAAISGPFNALSLNADISTAGSGTVNVPLSGSSSAVVSNLLTFTAPRTDSEEEEQVLLASSAKTQNPRSTFIAHAKVKVSPEVIASIEIDKDSGHMLTAGGDGSVVLDLNTAKDRFQLKGDYIINDGRYLFNIPGVVSKDFDIKEGSTLKFNGSIAESTLDVKAVHGVKTSLNTIVADSSAVSSRRLVECVLDIGGKIKSPEVSFDVNVPDLDPGTQMQVNAALNTNDKKQKQFVALLLFGTFLPSENVGVVNGTNMLLSNVGEIVSGQLNNILQKLEIPLDFGFGYQQDHGGADLFDVAVSTQLFNNRIIVNGSVGNRIYSTSTNPYGDVVGDLDIGYKIFKNGELMVKAFSHSADQHTSSLDFSQRNGAGISYQKEFDNLTDFFHQMFFSKKRRAREAQIEAEKVKEMKTITID